jgi:lysophospholipase L1-like esterase
MRPRGTAADQPDRSPCVASGWNSQIEIVAYSFFKFMKKRLWTSWLPLAGILLVLELALRVGIGERFYMFSDNGFSPTGAGDLLPSRHFIDVGKPTMPFRVKTNRLGTRNDREYSTRKPAGAFRILAMGDSLTYGVHVNNQDTWPQQLENLLRNEDHLQAEVLNTGGVGFTIEDEYLQFKEKGIHYDPDLAIVAFYANDLEDFSPAQRAIFKRVKDGSSLGNKIKHSIKERLRHSAIFCSLAYLRYQIQYRSILKTVTAMKDKNRETCEQDEEGAANPAYLKEYLAVLDRLVELAESRNIPVAFVFICNYIEIAQPQENLEKAKAAIRARLEDHHIPSLDLRPMLQLAGNAQSEYLLPDEWHMNRYGYWIAARGIRDFIRAKFTARFPEQTAPARTSK